MTYTLTQNENTIVRDADGAFIPTDLDNIDYAEYLAWCAEGNTPNEYVEPPVQPMVPPPSDKEQAEIILTDHEERITALEQQVTSLTNVVNRRR
jgi:hypothetical protein